MNTQIIFTRNIRYSFWVKKTSFFDPDPGSFEPWIRDGKFGSGINIQDPQGVEGFPLSGTSVRNRKISIFSQFVLNKKTKRILSPNMKRKKLKI
jgi:hypothetical protein